MHANSFFRQNLNFLVACFKNAGIKNIVVCPGSRNAPIISAFVNNTQYFSLVNCADERSAAFIAMGMALQTQQPAIVICTSGTAVANFYAAVCEARYQYIPLILISADRPEEAYHTWEGQTIDQKNIFGNNAKYFVEFQHNLHNQNYQNEIFELVELCLQQAYTEPFGPVHFNIPLYEPIYLEIENTQLPSSESISLDNALPAEDFSSILQTIVNKKILILVGQRRADIELNFILNQISQYFPVLADITSNIFISNYSLWYKQINAEIETNVILQKELDEVEVILSVGEAFLHKKLKKFFYKKDSVKHFHISHQNRFADFLQLNLIKVAANPLDFFTQLHLQTKENAKYNLIEICKIKPVELNNEEALLAAILNSMGNQDIIHLGNSLPVRWAAAIGKSTAEIFCNRGTSGIDGILSTAVGAALAENRKTVYCILGDISLEYDIHALWIENLPQNLKIICLNNQGGRIFEKIEGPAANKRLLETITTPQNRTFEKLAMHYKVQYEIFELSTNNSLEIANIIVKKTSDMKLYEILL